jgi:hypothetical protein
MQKEYKIKSGETIYDIAVKALNGLDNLVYIIADNPDKIVSIDDDLNLLAADVILIDDSYYQKTTPGLSLNQGDLATTTKVKGVDQQSALDICLEVYGTLDNYVKVLTDNDFSNSDSQSVLFKECTFDLSRITDNTVRTRLKRNGIRFTTLLEEEKGDYLVTEDYADIVGTEDDYSIIAE